MTKFRVKGALRETAEDVEFVIEASSYKEAERAANKMGILVNDVFIEGEPRRVAAKTVERVIERPGPPSENYFAKKRTSFNQASGCLKIVFLLFGFSCIISSIGSLIGNVDNEPTVNSSPEVPTNAWRDVPPELLRNRPPPEVRRERDQDESAKTQVMGIWREYIGWSDTGSDWVDWKISKASSGYEMAMSAYDGTGMTFELLRSDSPRGEIFKPVGKMLGTYWILNSMGNLEGWDADGKIDELAPK